MNETAPTDWNSVIYHDADCNGELSNAEETTTLTASIATSADQDVCVIHKVFAPSTASNGQQSVSVLTTDFVYGNGTTQAANQSLVNTDTTTIDTADKAGKLEACAQGSVVYRVQVE